MFALFAGYDYYPSGGWKDFQSMFDSIAAAEASAEQGDWDWWHVVDLTTQMVVA